MLRVRVELIPDGDEQRARVLGTLEVANTKAESLYTGAYEVVMYEYDERIPGRKSTFRTTAIMDNIERDIVRPMQLIGLALSVAAPVKRTISNAVLAPLGTILAREEL